MLTITKKDRVKFLENIDHFFKDKFSFKFQSVVKPTVKEPTDFDFGTIRIFRHWFSICTYL